MVTQGKTPSGSPHPIQLGCMLRQESTSIQAKPVVACLAWPERSHEHLQHSTQHLPPSFQLLAGTWKCRCLPKLTEGGTLNATPS